MEIDYEIERIQNGYIATSNDSTRTKRFYESIVDVVRCNTVDDIKDIQKDHAESNCEGEKYRITMAIKRV